MFTRIGRDVMRQNIDQSEVYQELEERLHEELDYINEAKNIALFQQMFRDDRDVLIPEVYPEFSSRRVLTMSRLEGYPFADILKPGVDQPTKDWVALKYFRVTWRQIFEFGTLHTDPHPGNYLVTYHPEARHPRLRQHPHLPREHPRRATTTSPPRSCARDEAAMADCFVRLGFLDPGDDPEPMIKIMDVIFEPVLIDKKYDPRDYDSLEKGMEIAQIGFEHRLFKAPGPSRVPGPRADRTRLVPEAARHGRPTGTASSRNASSSTARSRKRLHHRGHRGHRGGSELPPWPLCPLW